MLREGGLKRSTETRVDTEDPSPFSPPMRAVHSYSALFLVCLSAAHGWLYDHLSDLPDLKWVVIVGGGTAGSVLAHRLSEVRKHTVLLVEAGPSHEGTFDLAVPFLSWKLSFGTPFD